MIKTDMLEKVMLLRFIRNFRSGLNDNKVEKFINFDDAKKNSTLNAYQNKELCDVIAKKTLKKIEILKRDGFKANSSNIFLPAAICKIFYETGKKALNIVDFGGACGLHLFETKEFFKGNLNVNWNVVETTQMVLSAKEAGIKPEDLNFNDDIDKITSETDLFFASGALQCVENPYNTISKIIKMEPNYILFARMSLNQGDYEIITVQKSLLSHNGPGDLPEGYIDKEIRYPQTNISAKRFMAMMSLFYEIDWEFDDSSGIHNVPGENIIGKGYLFKRKNYNTER
jgi:putative methyltransferase (TIGR04325 family)